MEKYKNECRLGGRNSLKSIDVWVTIASVGLYTPVKPDFPDTRVSGKPLISPSVSTKINTVKTCAPAEIEIIKPMTFFLLSENERGKNYKPFTGCIEDLRINNKQIKMSDLKLKGEAMPGCGKQ